MSFIQPGKYIVTNVKGGTAIDLSGGDERSIIGFREHGQGNQQWEFIPEPSVQGGWRIKSDEKGLYLSVEGAPYNGQPVIAVDEGRSGVWWVVEDPDTGSWRIFYPGTEFNFDLEDFGNSTDGTKIQLWERTPGLNQTWYLKSV